MGGADELTAEDAYFFSDLGAPGAGPDGTFGSWATGLPLGEYPPRFSIAPEPVKLPRDPPRLSAIGDLLDVPRFYLCRSDKEASHRLVRVGQTVRVNSERPRRSVDNKLPG